MGAHVSDISPKARAGENACLCFIQPIVPHPPDNIGSLVPLAPILAAMSNSEAHHSPSDTSKAPAKSKRWLKPVAGVALIAAAWTGVVGHWLPAWARGKAEAAATEALGTPVRVGQIRIKPWTLEVGIDGLSLGPQAAPWLTLAHADTQVSLESIWRMAPVVRHVTLDQPMFWLDRQGAELFNISAVMAHLRAQAKPHKPDDKPARFAIFNIRVKDGVVRYTDQVLHQEHRVERMQLGIPFVSNLPSYLDAKVQPQFKADIDGSPLSIEGQALPFKEGLRSELKLDWRSVDVGHWLQAAQPFLPPGVQVQAQQGKLDTALRVQFEQRKLPDVPALIIQGGLKLSQLDISQKQVPGLGDIHTHWDTLQVEGLDTQPLLQQVAIRSVALDGLSFKAAPGATTGRQAQPKPSTEEPAGKPAKADPSKDAAKPWQWSVSQLHIGATRIDVQTSKEAAWPTLDHLVLNAKGLSGAPKAPAATWQLSLGTMEGTELKLDGQTHIHRQSTQAKLSLSQASIPAWLAPLKQALMLPLQIKQGELGFQGQITANLQADTHTSDKPAQAGIRLSEGVLQIKSLQTQAAAKGSPDKINLAALLLDGIDIDLPMPNDKPELRAIQLGNLTLDQLDARVTRSPQGQWLGMTSAQALPVPVPATASATSAKAATPPPVALKLLHCQACRVQITDQGSEPAALVDLQQADLHVQNISTDLSRTLNIKLATRAQGKGKLSFDGEVRPQPLQVKAKVGVADLDLRVLQTYLAPKVNVALASAKAQVDGRLTVQDDPKAGLSARYQGRLGLSDLRVLDRVNDADLLTWRKLLLEGSDLAWSPTALNADLGKISLQEFYGRVIINPNGKLNLAQLMRHPDDVAPQSLTTPQEAGAKATPPASAATPAGSAASAASPAAPAPAMNLRWQGIALTKGKVDFTDNFIKPNYSAKLTRIDGTISGVASNQPEPATVSVAGAVDDGAPLQISGQLHPLGPQLYTDISASAKGIELTRLSAYASRYAGYSIDKGTLSMNVHYKVDGGKLAAENQIFLDQLTFGDKTDSPDATGLPVKLAVALLKNAKGEIDINLPISGSLSDPQFSVGGIIWKVIVNLIGKALTSPFALLSGGGDELGFVPFPAGSASLDEAAAKRLDTLSAKLKDHPSLKLEATGRADPALDVEGLREAHVMKLMVAAKAKALDASPDEISIAPEEKDQWLAAAYKAADIKKPRNMVGITKTLPAAEMSALLKAAAPTGPEALKALANQRGNAVKAYLAERIPAERVLLTTSKLGTEGLPEDKGPSTRVQFDIK